MRLIASRIGYPKGTRTIAESPCNPAFSDEGGTESGTLDAVFDSLPPDLVRLIESWEHLPSPAKAEIMEMVNAAVPEGG